MNLPIDTAPTDDGDYDAWLAMNEDRIPTAFRSSFAYQQISQAARRGDLAGFTLALVPVFGYDLPPTIYNALREEVLAGNVQPPPIELVTDGPQAAVYDHSDRIIRLHVGPLIRAIDDPAQAWELAATLLEAFEHHLHNIVRNDLVPALSGTTDNPMPDLTDENRPSYTLSMAEISPPRRDDVRIGNYSTADQEDAHIRTSFRNIIAKITGTHAGHTDISDGDAPPAPHAPSARFGAGAGSAHHHTHESIEKILEELGFTPEEMQSVTFGNWLRDYSQVVDPKLVRAADSPPDFPSVAGREALTQMVDVLAARKFNAARVRNPEAFTVTPEILGVYRPSEHIDNPKVDTTPPEDSPYDPDFEPWVFPEDELLEVDYDESMKRYIQRSMDTMREDLEAAMALGRTEEGLRRFGSALHILEDFFAHTNYVELGLIKQGHDVLPWTAPGQCRNGYPIVTGTFGSIDAFASLVTAFAKLLKPTIDWRFTPSEPGYRSDNEKLVLILLKESERHQELAAFDTYLTLRDELAATPGGEWVELLVWVTSIPARLIGSAFLSMFASVITLIANRLDDIQTISGSDPNMDASVDPTHTQLSKDHSEHPLHELAAMLASIAIRDVAKAMIQRWKEGPDGPNPVIVASSYFIHPNDTYSVFDGSIRNWAARNEHRIRRAASKTEMETVQESLEQATQRAFGQLTHQGKSTLEYLAEHFIAFFKRL
ncbi:HET-C-related protein [Pseudomonas sp. NPDC088368]|jgi:hypothetical protein|uniref:HET-C-related protein n=1 Tax=Pseudomonas sp. NPDC088368 TaxID=3364453 RepID=UPI00381976EF